ncbi:hypothetical protein BVRB_5g103420 [Beta vulgaris subsp. vulgaris]|nr:hypothetical protein BVRB_5g103420 [Beta vulgaris subsp. vulgaris]
MQCGNRLIMIMEKIPTEIAKYLISKVINSVATDQKDLVEYAEEFYYGGLTQVCFQNFVKAHGKFEDWKAYLQERE